jgi:hypothetical protein
MIHDLLDVQRVPFDLFELIGMAGGLIAAALFVRYVPALLPGAGPLAQGIAAALSVAAAIVPFVVRRARRRAGRPS